MLILHQSQKRPILQFTDEELWVRFRAGDQEALSQLYDRHINLLFRYGRRFTKNEEVIKDCLQDLFSDLIVKVSSLSETTCVVRYLMKALRRRIIADSQRYVYQSIDEHISFGLVPSMEEQLIDNESIQWQKLIIQQVIGRLPKRQQEIVYLKYFYNLDNQLIGEVLSLNYQAVCNLSYRALKSVRTMLSHQLPIQDSNKE